MDNNMSSNKEPYDFFKSLDRSTFMNDEYKEYAKEGSIDVESLGDVVFVELKGKYGRKH